MVCAVSLLVLNIGLVRITARRPAVDTLTMAMALLHSPSGLDDPKDIVDLQRQVEKNSAKSIRPMPGMRITLQADQIVGRAPREVRLAFFRKWAQPLYEQGATGLSALATDPQQKASILDNANLYDLMTLRSHVVLTRVLLGLAGGSVVLLVLLILFSHRFGRIGSPGFVLLAASLPGALFFTILTEVVYPQSVPPGGTGVAGMAGYLASNLIPNPAQTLSQTFLLFFVIGFGLIVVSALARIVAGIRKSNAAPRTDEEERWSSGGPGE